MKMTFKDLSLAPEVQATLDTLGFTEPTKIQAQAIPLLLEKTGIDIHGQAQTGTGKTLAFGIPLLHRIDRSNKATQALVVAPTRELALQICESLKPFTSALGISIKTIYGGVSIEEQSSALRRGVQLVVGTPGRINDHLRRGVMKIDQISTLVLDEADIMLDMGFKEDVDQILSFAKKDREIWLFSATVKSGIQAIMKKHMKTPLSVRVSRENVGTSSTKQYCCIIPMRSRLKALARFIESAPDFYGFVFCQTKILTSEVADKLRRHGYNVGALHGDMSQVQRNAVIKKFKKRDYSIVVATDVAARGIDIQDLTHVINYSLPEDHESYVHRTGRTGRAGKEGVAITFINKSETRFVSMIKRKFNITIEPIEVPSREDIIRGRIVKASEYLESMSAPNKDMAVHANVSTLVEQFNEDQLRAMMMRVIQDKFLDSIMKEEDIVAASVSRFGDESSPNQEIVLAVGLDDDLDRDSMIEFLKSNGLNDEEQIQKIRIIRRRTFIEVPTGIAMNLYEKLRNTKLAGRPTHAQLVDSDSSSRRRGSAPRGGGGRQRRGGSGYGGYRENRESRGGRSYGGGSREGRSGRSYGGRA